MSGGEHNKPLVRIEITTTAAQATTLLKAVVGKLSDDLRDLGIVLRDCTEDKAFGSAIYKNEKIRKALEAVASAQQQLETLTTQGEEENGNTV